MASVLIADDDHSVLFLTANLVEAIMEAAGIVGTVHKSTNGLEGLRIFKRNQEDIMLVIADVEMPEMNGLEMLREIKTVSPGTVTALHTAHTDPQKLEQFRNSGVVDEILQKGSNVKDFAVIIERAITGKS